MAKSKETFTKKEKEKKRIKQKQEKRERMAERKANKKSGQPLENMMAYLDEDGNLTDTPPNTATKKTFKKENIIINIPKQEEITNDRRSGTVNFYNQAKGYGFINEKTSNEKLFFHFNDLLEPVKESDLVSFLVTRGPKGLVAVQIRKL